MTDSPEDAVIAQPEPEKWNCPAHGVVTHIMQIMIENQRSHYCLLCYRDFLTRNLPPVVRL